MLVSTKDILYLVISFCIIWATFFLCWTFYYLMRLLRNANTIVEEFRVRLQTLSEAIDYIRGKVENISSLMTLAGSGVTGFVKRAAEKKAKKWIDDSSDEFNDVAKEAVDAAFNATARNMKKVAKKIRS
jgi:hypothetical protein